MPVVNWKIDAGHVLLLVVTVVGLAVSWGAMSTKLDDNAKAIAVVGIKLDTVTEKVERIRDEQVRNSTKIEDLERMGITAAEETAGQSRQVPPKR